MHVDASPLEHTKVRKNKLINAIPYTMADNEYPLLIRYTLIH